MAASVSNTRKQATDLDEHGSASAIGGESMTNTTNATNQQKSNKPNSHHQSKEARQVKALVCLYVIALSLIALFAVFIVTWPLKAACSSCVSDMLLEIGYWICYAYSTVNPIILLIFHDSFNKRFVKTLINLRKKILKK